MKIAFDLILWCVLALGPYAYDITRVRAPLGPLGVTLDYSMATSWPPNTPLRSQVSRSWSYSSRLIFRNPVSSISNGQLWQLVRDAQEEMMADIAQYNLPKAATPGAIGVLAFDNELMFSSTQKGSLQFMYDHTGASRTLETLNLCSTVWKEYGPYGNDKPHMARGSCAEIMLSYLYEISHDTPIEKVNPRVAAFVHGKPDLPCGSDPKGDYWGCALHIAGANMHPVDITIAPESYNLQTLAGGVVKRDQIEVCRAIRPL